MSNSTINTDMSTRMRQALDGLAADPALLTQAQRDALDEQGFCVLADLIDTDWLAALRQGLEELYAEEGNRGGVEVHTEGGARRLSDLVNKGAVFDRVWTHPVLLAAVAWQLGRDFKLSSLNARDALPEAGRQKLHADWGPYDGNFHVCNSIWLLDDFSASNGATRLVPRTHRQILDRAYFENPELDHPDQIIVDAPAGSVCVFSAHLWHGGTQNVSDSTRRAMHCYYVTREHPQQLDQQRYLRYTTWKRLSAEQKYILGVED